jgi:ribosome-binding protein aMBF1 (putative translation factor)
MLNPKPNSNSSRKMTPSELAKYQLAVAEEMSGKEENKAAARAVARRLRVERKVVAELVAQLRETREKAGVSLGELAERTGMSKPSLSRLENSDAPNPTIITLLRYAQALGVKLDWMIT